MLTNAAKQDYNIWLQVVSDKTTIGIPKGYSNAGKEYWRILADTKFKKRIRYRTTEEVSKAYPHPTKGMSILYSKGLESSLLIKLWPDADKLEFKPTKEIPWTNPIEPLLAIITADKGYNVTYFGQERKPGVKFKDIEIYNELLLMWYKHTGRYFMSPLVGFDKLQIFDSALVQKIKFHSCYNYTVNKPWCGECVKCVQINHLYTYRGLRSPIKLKKSWQEILKTAHSDEVEYTLKMFKEWKT
jgi:hypothetical protein